MITATEQWSPAVWRTQRGCVAVSGPGGCLTLRQQSRRSDLRLCLSPPRKVVKTPRWPGEQLRSSPAQAFPASLCKYGFSRNFFFQHMDVRSTWNPEYARFRRSFYRGSLVVTLCPRSSTASRLSSVTASTQHALCSALCK